MEFWREVHHIFHVQQGRKNNDSDENPKSHMIYNSKHPRDPYCHTPGIRQNPKLPWSFLSWIPSNFWCPRIQWTHGAWPARTANIKGASPRGQKRFSFV